MMPRRIGVVHDHAHIGCPRRDEQFGEAMHKISQRSNVHAL